MTEERLEFKRMRPMYDKSIHQHYISFFKDSPPAAVPFAEFKLLFKQWIISSKLNMLRNLDDYSCMDIIHGVTHYLDDIHSVFGDKLITLPNDYPYHWRIKPNMRISPFEKWKNGDVAIISVPFCYTGNLPENYQAIINHCLVNDIDLHIDAAWFGPCRGIEIDLSAKCIKSIAFSLSKVLGLGMSQIGLRFCNERWIGPVSIVNDYGYLNHSAISLGIDFMKNFSIDYFQDKYGKAYQDVVRENQLIPSSSIHIARKELENGVIVPVGIRGLLREKVEGVFR